MNTSQTQVMEVVSVKKESRSSPNLSPPKDSAHEMHPELQACIEKEGKNRGLSGQEIQEVINQAPKNNPME